ncbi:Crp/Fnr family transcriptional regulator [Cyanobium sp. T1B-Tous]|uniref:Crp/Fnr family transcriptional regulator n=1 Tax=Cyanobium sp. T1B-Tous TaxID=2823721 RepID=UPI0020CC17B5|nr:cyclic nucleotide-binding domain-containing protein [Cyanobium sp. T1B-Tous]MCP9805340.1 Crp/Fnr family transcriptional regulator [Cyanobium sp. T1B-Tous]
MATPSVDEQILRSMQLLEPEAPIRMVEPGEVIFQAGEHGECLFGVLEGQVSLNWSGKGQELLGAGRCFGEGALVQSGHTRHGTATALQPTRLLVMNREAFLFAMEALPMFSLELIASLERRLKDLRQAQAQ